MANQKQLKAYARTLRKKATPSEQKAKKALKSARIAFKFQVPFKYYILDFLIPSRLLIVEVDGGYHKTRTLKDKRRDKFCRSMGLKVLRIKNKNVGTIVAKVKKYSRVKNFKAKLQEIMNSLN